MEIEYKDVSFGVRRTFEDQFAVETRVDAAERGGASKVLSVEAEAKVTGIELLPGEARIGGKVNYRLLYLDGQEKLCGLDYFKDFAYDLMGEDIRAGENCELDLSIVEASGRAEGDGVELTAIVGANLTVYGERTERAVAAIKGAEVKETGASAQRYVSEKEYAIELEKEENVGADIKKIVLFDATAAILQAGSDGGSANVSGEAKASVVYVTEDGQSAEKTFSIPFSREEEIEGGAAKFGLRVKNARVILSGDEENATIGIEIVLALQIAEFSESEIGLIADAYSIENEAENAETAVECLTFSAQKFYKETLTGAIEAEGVKRVISVRPGGVAVANVTPRENSVKVEGVASFTSVYETESGFGRAENELPFSFELPFAGAGEGWVAEASARVTAVSHSIVSGGVGVAAEMNVEVSLFEKKEVRFLSDVAEGAPRENEEAGITVYFAESGEDVWAIAKAMRAAPSALLKANPFLSEPLNESKKILIFRGRE